MWNGCEIYHLKNTIHSSVKDHCAGARPSKRSGKNLDVVRKLTKNYEEAYNNLFKTST